MLGSATADASGRWTFTPDLTDGPYTPDGQRDRRRRQHGHRHAHLYPWRPRRRRSQTPDEITKHHDAGDRRNGRGGLRNLLVRQWRAHWYDDGRGVRLFRRRPVNPLLLGGNTAHRSPPTLRAHRRHRVRWDLRYRGAGDRWSQPFGLQLAATRHAAGSGLQPGLYRGHRIRGAGGRHVERRTDTQEATIQRLYEGLLGRPGDTAGLSQWDAAITAVRRCRRWPPVSWRAPSIRSPTTALMTNAQFRGQPVPWLPGSPRPISRTAPTGPDC